jgi:hypothetical protein
LRAVPSIFRLSFFHPTPPSFLSLSLSLSLSPSLSPSLPLSLLDYSYCISSIHASCGTGTGTGSYFHRVPWHHGRLQPSGSKIKILPSYPQSLFPGLVALILMFAVSPHPILGFPRRIILSFPSPFPSRPIDLRLPPPLDSQAVRSSPPWPSECRFVEVGRFITFFSSSSDLSYVRFGSLFV